MFVAIYIFEAIIKILSRGFGLGQFTFIRDPWNWLDIFIIIMAIVTEFVALDSISVFRILKIIPLIPGLRATSRALFQPVKRLAEVTIVIAFFLSVFAVLGMHFFMGSLMNKCQIHFNQSFDNEGFAKAGSYINNPEYHYFRPSDVDALVCGNFSSAGTCPEGFICMRGGKNPNYGYTNFDSFGWGFLSALRIMTHDFWWNLAELTVRATAIQTIIYFAMVLFPASFYLLSLFMGMVAMATAERSEASAAEAKRREEDFAEILQALKKCEVEEWLKQRLYTFVMDPFFELGIVICLIVNVLFLSMEHYPMVVEFYGVLSHAELVFIFIYTLEMILKLVAMGLCGYFQMNWNVFECTIVFGSLMELGVADVSGFSIIRSLRLLRVIRLAKWWPTFNLLLRIVRNSMGALRNLTLFLVLMVFFFSVAGMHLFGQSYIKCACKIAVDCELPRWHMADLFHSFLVVFRILCGNWIELLWDCMEVSGQATCLIFYITVLVIGKLLILGLFMGLLLSNLAAPEEDKEGVGKNKIKIALNRIKKALTHVKPNNTDGTGPDGTGPDVTSEGDDKKEYLALTSVTTEQPVSKKVEEKKGDTVQDRNTPEDCCCDMCHQCCSFLETNTSRGIWRIWSNFRKCCLSIVEHRFFQLFIILIIQLSCFTLMAEDINLESRQILKVILKYADLVFTIVFVVEMILKMLGYGLKRYFTKNWCWLEFFVVNVSLISVTINMLELSNVLPFRGWKTLRSLRMLSFFRGTKVVLNALLCVLPSLFDVLLVGLTVWLFFGVVGVNLFAGKFYYCFNETSEEYILHEDVNNKTECLFLIEANYTEMRWKNLPLNFDHVPAAYLSLLNLNKCRAGVYSLVTSWYFEVFMVVVICINVLVLASETYSDSFEKEVVLYWIHFIILIIFLIESILKIVAFGRDFFRDCLNTWDLGLILLSIPFIFIPDLLGRYLPNIYTPLSMIRLVRVFRVLRLHPKAAGIRSLLWALEMSFPALFNIGILLFIIMFTYAAVGMSAFPYVKKGAMINDLVNFETFPNSIMTMFMITTITGWDGLLYPLMSTPPDCDWYIENPGTAIRGDCSNTYFGIFFLTSYIIICFLLLLSVFFVIILEIFDMFAEEDEEPLSDDDLQMFYDTWKRFDPDASQCIQYSNLSEFCDALKDPLRIPKPNTIKLIHMDLPLLPGDKIHYLDILLALRAQVSYEPISSTLRRKKEEVAAAAIQRVYRKWRLASRDGTEGLSGQMNGGSKQTEMEPATNGQMRT
ncbi:sodium channel protein type 4 subunit alpha-like [Scomber scombrus]|uniref:Sodium channel protein n=1 Tax=Scomber scombrus TaxID=13677 RepID=A0AAV1Q3S1_SCOSC